VTRQRRARSRQTRDNDALAAEPTAAPTGVI